MASCVLPAVGDCLQDLCETGPDLCETGPDLCVTRDLCETSARPVHSYSSWFLGKYPKNLADSLPQVRKQYKAFAQRVSWISGRSFLPAGLVPFPLRDRETPAQAAEKRKSASGLREPSAQFRFKLVLSLFARAWLL